jgi:[NiFe] hydrogenase diaphorase moiety large subunit
MQLGADWFAGKGTKGSSGTKVLSVSGDCKLPGVYEVPFGIKVSELLKMAGAKDTAAVQVGGPSGQMIGAGDFNRTICYDDLATGGSVMIFNSTRNILDIASKFMEFFIEESCGYCTPCRTGNVLIKERLDRIIAGKGEPSDLDYLKELGESVKFSSRCGLGQTSPNPALSTMKNFHGLYEKLVKSSKDGLMASFDIKTALVDAEAIAGRPSEKFN